MHEQAQAPLLRAEGLYFGYPGRPPLFTNWHGQLDAGITLLRGGESRGKSTLLRLLAGTLPATRGQLEVLGLGLGLGLATQPEAYRRQVFLADAGAAEFDAITALQYLAAQRLRTPAPQVDALPALLGGLGLEAHQHKPLYMLSTGSRRKVGLAAALASGAAVTLLDAPCAALDRASIAFLVRWLCDASAQDRHRAWVVADYEAPEGLVPGRVIDLGD